MIWLRDFYANKNSFIFNRVNFIYQTKSDQIRQRVTDTTGDSRIVSQSNGPSVDLNCNGSQNSQLQIPGTAPWLIVTNIGITIIILTIIRKNRIH